MDTWTSRMLRMLAVPACVAVAGLAMALLLHGLAGWAGSPALLHWAAGVFQAGLVLALALSGWGYRRLQGRSCVRIDASSLPAPAWTG